MSRKAKSTLARDALESRIGYTFADKAILDRALTHVSAASPSGVPSGSRCASYSSTTGSISQRREPGGDAVSVTTLPQQFGGF